MTVWKVKFSSALPSVGFQLGLSQFSIRAVPRHCIYGVDRKHLFAVRADFFEMEKWIIFVR
jgi:hypothetical protein